MKLRCRTDQQYFSGTEKKHLDTFYKDGPQEKMVYTNANGDRRQVDMIKFPLGFISKLTVFHPIRDEDGNDLYQVYHTPTATLENTKEAKVWYKDLASSENLTCTSREWNAWAGKDCPSEKKVVEGLDPSVVAHIAGMKDSLADREDAKAGPEFKELQEKSEGSKWQSPTKRKRK